MTSPGLAKRRFGCERTPKLCLGSPNFAKTQSFPGRRNLELRGPELRLHLRSRVTLPGGCCFQQFMREFRHS